jgi:hypothetical protein
VAPTAVRSKLAKEAPVIGPHPLFDETTFIVEPKDVREIPDYALSVRGQRASRRLCELADKLPLDPRLASNVLAFDENDAATDRAIVERSAYGLEVVGKPAVVRLRAAGLVEAELLRVE